VLGIKQFAKESLILKRLFLSCENINSAGTYMVFVVEP